MGDREVGRTGDVFPSWQQIGAFVHENRDALTDPARLEAANESPERLRIPASRPGPEGVAGEPG